MQIPLHRTSGGKASDIVITCRESTAKTLPNGPNARVTPKFGIVKRIACVQTRGCIMVKLLWSASMSAYNKERKQDVRVTKGSYGRGPVLGYRSHCRISGE